MSLRKKIATGIVTISVVGALVGGATLALFTDTETSTGSFKAGKVDLAVCPEVSAAITCMAPGDAGSVQFHLFNKACLDLVWKATPTFSGDLASGTNGIKVTSIQIKEADGDWVDYDAALAQIKGLTPGQTTANVQDMKISYELPLAADNAYVLKDATLTVDFDAEQVKNNASPFAATTVHTDPPAPDEFAN